jgi:hypothetical protein
MHDDGGESITRHLSSTDVDHGTVADCQVVTGRKAHLEDPGGTNPHQYVLAVVVEEEGGPVHGTIRSANRTTDRLENGLS